MSLLDAVTEPAAARRAAWEAARAAEKAVRDLLAHDAACADLIASGVTATWQPGKPMPKTLIDDILKALNTAAAKTLPESAADKEMGSALPSEGPMPAGERKRRSASAGNDCCLC